MTERLRAAFREQADHCAALDSPFMARLLLLLAEQWPEDTELAKTFRHWTGDIGPMGASLPLRLAGGLHALHLSGKDAPLSAVYPPQSGDDHAFAQAVTAALRRHDGFLCAWVRNAPQTNEIRRAAALIAATHLLASRYTLPMRISELGASGGLNLMFDRFTLRVGNTRLGPKTAAVELTPEWAGKLPVGPAPTIVERRGVDLNPLDPKSQDGAMRLLSYLWPDQTERLSRTRAAIDIHDAKVDRGDAIDWLETRLAHEVGQLHLIYHTIAWQYFPPSTQKRGTEMMEAAGALADDETPLAWVRMEADGHPRGARLDLRLWPGDRHIELGRVDFHGRWLDWTAPDTLP